MGSHLELYFARNVTIKRIGNKYNIRQAEKKEEFKQTTSLAGEFEKLH